jgi:histidine triad (HIT) family protein
MSSPVPTTSQPGPACEFCEIVAGRLPHRVRFEDDQLLAIHNRLTWAPVMLLVIPKLHMGQQEFWTSSLFARAATLAVRLGDEDCPNGYRILSNMGRDALQTQPHGHLHVVGGGALGLYVSGRLAGFAPGPWYPQTPAGPA